MNIDGILIVAAVAMIAAAVAIILARRLKLGSTIALIAVGILLGPHSPVALLTNLAGLEAVGDVGVALLLFGVGMDTLPASMWQMRRQLLKLGGTQFLLVSAAVAALLFWRTSEAWPAVLVLALGLSMSSDAIAFGTLQERGEQDTPQGLIVKSLQIFQTLIAIPIIAAIPILAASASKQAPSTYVASAGIVLFAMLAIYVTLRYVLPALLTLTARRLGSGAFGLVILSAVIASSAVLDSLGVSMALGALLAGIVLSESAFADQIKASVAPAKQLLLGLFFVAMGMSIDFHALTKAAGALLIGMPIIFAIKVVGTYVCIRSHKLSARAAVSAAILMIPCDEIAYVIFKSAHERSLITATAYAASLSLISASFVLSPLIISLVFRFIDRFPGNPQLPVRADLVGAARRRVIVIGYGYIGRAVCAFLVRAKMQFVAFDIDLEHIALAGARGHDVRYGDATNPSLMSTASFDEARLIVIATGKYDVARSVLTTLRQFHAAVPVVTAVQYLAQRDALLKAGARDVVALMPEGVLQFGRHVLSSLGAEESLIAQTIKAFEADDFALWRGVDIKAAKVP